MPPSSEPQAAPDRAPRTTVVGAFLEGWRRALGAPGLVLALWVVMTAATLPLTAVLREAAQAGSGPVTSAERTLHGWNVYWTGEVDPGARSFAANLTREAIGAAGLSATVGNVYGGGLPPATTGAAIAVCLALWIFLSGGAIDRLARGRPLDAPAFMALASRYSFRLLRLALVAGACFWLLFAIVRPLLFGVVFNWLTAAAGSPSSAAGVLSALNGLFALLVALVALVVDFTCVRLVVEDRRSVLAAIAAGLRFVRRRFWRTAGVYAINVLALTVLARLWLEATPDVGTGWPALLLAQFYIVARVWGRLAFLGSEAVFFQGELAHAGYTAAPAPRWPDSVSIEAIRNLKQRP